jgi:hypothetical protein
MALEMIEEHREFHEEFQLLPWNLIYEFLKLQCDKLTFIGLFLFNLSLCEPPVCTLDFVTALYKILHAEKLYR